MGILLLILGILLLLVILGIFIASGLLVSIFGIGFWAALLIIIIIKFIFDIRSIDMIKVLLFIWLILFIIDLIF